MSSHCPSVLDLGSPAPAVRDHISSCGRCQALQRTVVFGDQISSDTEHDAPLDRTILDSGIAERGAVWALSAPSTDTFLFVVVLAADDTEAWVVPGTDELDPIDTDFHIPAERLGFELWIRAAHSFKALREQLHDQIGRLSNEEVETVLMCVETLLDGKHLVTDERFGVPVIADSDPRVAASSRWADDTAGWREPWAVLSVADELGAVCAARRCVLGISIADLAAGIDVAAEDWRRFESATLDLPAELPIARLAAGVRRLSLPIGRKLLVLAATSVTRTHRPDTGTQTLALARRRQGKRRTTGAPDPDEVRAAADRYAKALGRTLGL
jgi:hypothetical protein